jgi:hypothetical protein
MGTQHSVEAMSRLRKMVVIKNKKDERTLGAS